MSRDRKIGVLEALLQRVRNRAGAPRVAAAPAPSPNPVAAPREEAPAEILAAPTAALASEPPVAAPVPMARESGPPEIEIIPPPPPPPYDDAALSDLPDDDDDDGPPSAPRLREGIAAEAADDEPDEPDQDFQDDEVPIKTPPPESGRQHVAAVVSQSEDADELEAEIAITVTEGSPSPPPAEVSEPHPSSPPVREPFPSSVREQLPQIDIEANAGPMPRLAFVSEPEIDLHASRPPTAPPPAGPSHVSGPPAPPPVAAKAPTEPPPPLPSSPPPVRLMAQPAGGAEGTAAPVEVWASTHAPTGLRGHVASFVGQNATFAPKSFGELLDASLALGES